MRSDAIERGSSRHRKARPLRIWIRSRFRGGTIMLDLRRMPTAVAILFGLNILQPAKAQAFELTGAWASQTDLCPLVFTRKGNQVVFTELSDLFGSGFIVDGDRIRG